MDREVISKSRVTVEEERNNGGGISRRTFLKGVGGVAAAAAVLGLSGLKSKALAQTIPASITLPKERLLEAYRRMQRIRQGELKLRELLVRKDPIMRGPCHTSAGEEATCVGVAMAMEKGDQLTGSHRSHGYPLALGLDLKPWMAELFGKVTGTQRGHVGSMHITEPALGMLGMTGIVGAGVPIALGAAKGFKILGKKQVAISTCGDGAMNSAGFGASPNLAAIWNVPVVFVINNNQWMAATPNNWDQSLVQAGETLSTRAAGFGIPGITVDGNDLAAVYKAAKWCIDQARMDKGPSLLECITFRHWQHSGPGDHEVTRWPHNRPEELEYWLRRDPIKRFERTVVQGGLLTEAELGSVRKEVGVELETALEFGRNSALPDPEVELKYQRDVFGA